MQGHEASGHLTHFCVSAPPGSRFLKVEPALGSPWVLVYGRGTVSVCSVNCQRKFTLITYCVRTSTGEKRKCLCSDKACVRGGGPMLWARMGGWTAEWHRVRGKGRSGQRPGI